jgi:hypothetical protein
VKIPGWRIALLGAALAVLTVAGIGLAHAAPPSGADPVVVDLAAALIAPSEPADNTADLRLRPLRHVVHGTITFDHPKEGLTTVQVDGGTIAAVDADSITIAEAGGASITVAIDAQTRVRLAGKRSTVTELKVGQTVRVISRIGTGTTATARWIGARAGK